jgi:hypothetical protein
MANIVSKLFMAVALTLAFKVIAYFGAYFIAADYVDFGDNRHIYLLRYRIGAHSLDGCCSFFEPARRIDDFCFRGRNAAFVLGANTINE